MKTVNKAKTFRSNHQYALEEMGISTDQVLKEFDQIFNRFDFDRDLEGISPAGKESTLN
jgi:hypothetical protein